jgi:MFS transporter, DHA3 family, macrolide efflux protein
MESHGFSAKTYGLLMALLSVGAVLGGAFLFKIRTQQTYKLKIYLSIFMVFDGVSFILLSISNNLILIGSIMLLLGITSSVYFILIETILQLETKQNNIGRVFSSYNMCVNIFSFISIGIFGLILENTPISYVLILAGSGILLSILILIFSNQKLKEEINIENFNDSAW